jgi:hypothetical protein
MWGGGKGRQESSFFEKKEAKKLSPVASIAAVPIWSRQ